MAVYPEWNKIRELPFDFQVAVFAGFVGEEAVGGLFEIARRMRNEGNRDLVLDSAAGTLGVRRRLPTDPPLGGDLHEFYRE